MVTTKLEISELTGYSEADTYVATRYRQGDREVFSIDLGLDRVTNLVREPDPDKPTEANRTVDRAHAEGFAKYLRGRANGVIPTLMLRAPSGVFEFEESQSVHGTSWGKLAIPRLAREDIAIIDGQHRILGMHIASKEIAHELNKARSHRDSARRDGDDAQYNFWNKEVEKLQLQRKKFAEERVSLQIVIVDDQKEYQQIFVDIADNAKGIAQSIRARMDSTKVVNRSLELISSHPLVLGRIDREKDRMLKGEPYILTLKDLANISRTIAVGLAGRVSARLEDELKESEIANATLNYLGALVEGFEDMRQVADGELIPADLRKQSLLGSVTVLRVLSDVYKKIDDHNSAVAFFKTISPWMGIPIPKGSRWLESKSFKIGAMAPTARMGDQRNLSDTIMKWHEEFVASEDGAASG